MRKLFLYWLLAIAIVATAANPSQAGQSNTAYLNISFVSSTGDHANQCDSPKTACASITRALSQTVNYGEIDCVNAADYYITSPPITITQSLTIDCSDGPGSRFSRLTINAPGDVVRLRSVTMSNLGFGFFGVDAQSVAALYVENCIIVSNNNGVGDNFPPYFGIRFEPSANAKLFVTNSIISDNGDSSQSFSGGIYIAPSPGTTAQVVIDRSEVNGNYFGIVGDGRPGGIIRGTISDSVVSGNTMGGVTAISSGASVAFLLDQTKVSGNLAGLYASGSNAVVLARNSSVFNNTTGLEAVNGGKLLTSGNNTVIGNPTNGAFTGTAALQ